MLRIILISLIALTAVTIAAQDAPTDCPLREQEAFTNMQNACFELAPGEICYGNDTVSTLDVRDNTPQFDTIGDRAFLENILEWSVSAEDSTWGITLLNLRLYSDSEWLPQVVTMMAFGNVQIANLGNENINLFTRDLRIDTPEGANIRVQPDTEYRVIEPVLQGTFVKATGRLSDSTWVRLQMRDGETGWISSLAFDVDLTDLPVVTANQPAPELIYPAMQVFDFQSGMNDARCREASPSGILLQTPDNTYSPTLIINDVELRFRGTIFLQAQPQSTMIINVIEGEADMVAFGESRFIPVANRVQIPINFNQDDQIVPIDTPATRETYIYEQLLFLPVDYLPRSIYVTPDLTRYITPRPNSGGSPLEGMALDALCTFTVGQGGVNLRAGPGQDYPIQGVMNFRESAKPIGRVVYASGISWWKIADFLWVRVDTTVTGGDCFAVPTIDPPPSPR